MPGLDEDDEGGFFVAFFVRLGLAAAFFAAAGFFAAAFFAAAGFFVAAAFFAVAAFFATGLFAAGFAIFLVTELLDAGLEAGLEARAAAIGGANSRTTMQATIRGTLVGGDESQRLYSCIRMQRGTPAFHCVRVTLLAVTCTLLSCRKHCNSQHSAPRRRGNTCRNSLRTDGMHVRPSCRRAPGLCVLLLMCVRAEASPRCELLYLDIGNSTASASPRVPLTWSAACWQAATWATRSRTL